MTSSDPALAWQHAFSLERWVLLARGHGTQVTPLALEIDGRGVIAVFSSAENAPAFGEQLGLPAQEAGQLLAIPPTEAVAYLLQFVEDGVDAAVLDPGTADAAVLLAALPHVQQLSQG